MKPKWRQIVRKISILVALMILSCGGIIYNSTTMESESTNLFGLFIIGLAVYVALDPGAVRKALTGRQAKMVVMPCLT